MSCSSCGSDNQAEFPGEINIHHSGLENVSRHPVLVFARIMVCLSCGCSQFSTPRGDLASLATGTKKAKA